MLLKIGRREGEGSVELSELSFWDHVETLRLSLVRSGWTIVLSALCAFCFHKHILHLLLAFLPLELYLLSPLEGFLTAAKASLWTGIVASSPLWIYFLLSFFLPALKKQEKVFILPFFLLSCIFCCAGVIFAYMITIPLVLKFFTLFNTGLGINLWSLKQTFDLILNLILAHGLIFELYVILIFLIKYQLLSTVLLKKMRKGVIVGIFILAAILTPPDVLSQLLLAIPMVILFETALLYSRIRKN